MAISPVVGVGVDKHPGDRSLTLNLDFASGSMDSRIVSTRGSHATLWDKTGRLTYAPNNLLTYSSTFSNTTAWYRPGTTIAAYNVATAPDGTFTATKVSNTPNQNSNISQGISPPNGVYCRSIYAKADGSGYSTLIFEGIGGPSGAGDLIMFDVVTKTFSGSTGTPISYGYSNEPNGWVRIWAVVEKSASKIVSNSIYIGGYGSSPNQHGIYIWGAQFEAGNKVGVYSPTTDAAYYGPRFDYDPSTLQLKGLLQEETRTNIYLNTTFASATTGIGVFPTAWTNVGANTNNVTVVPNIGPGVSSNIMSHRRIGGTGYEGFQPAAAPGITASTYSVSAYLRVPTGVTATACGLYTGNSTPSVTVLASAAQLNAQPKDVWVLYSATFTYGPVTVTDTPGFISTGGAIGTGWDLASPQLELGAFPTSYIPTFTTSAVRNIDVTSLTGSNLNSWLNPSEGTMCVTCDSFGRTTSNYANIFWIAIDGNVRVSIYYINNTGIAGEMRGGGANGSTSYGAVGTGAFSVAYGYKSNSSNIAVNGNLGTTDTASIVPVNLTAATIGGASGSTSINGHIKSIKYYNVRKPDSQLQALTV